MKLAQLLSIYGQLKLGAEPSQEVKGIAHSSSKVQAGFVFVALRGARWDGHEFLEEAVRLGAIALIVESDELVPSEYTGAQVKVSDSRRALDKIVSRYYDYPANELFSVGITGTNGKTSVAYMVEHILNNFGWATGVMGTIDHHLGERCWESQLTTPDALVLQRRLREFRSLGAEAVVMEVSSHSLVQKRVDEMPFNVMVFTNLSRDHLDYHKDMDEYFKAKERLFVERPTQPTEGQTFAVINSDDSYGQQIQLAGGIRRWTFGEGTSDFEFHVKEQSFNGTTFHLKSPRGEGDVFLSMVGKHNVYNAVAAIAVGLAAGVSFEACCVAMEKFKRGVKGRLEAIDNSLGLHIFVDFAHTDQALQCVLASLADLRNTASQQARIILVYGCGGDRDRGKRKIMAQVALAGADHVIVTSDNPRSEDPVQIIEDGVRDFTSEINAGKLEIEVLRAKAIHKALALANKGDVVLVAGKGHEAYQIIGDQKVSFSDQETINSYLTKNKGTN